MIASYVIAESLRSWLVLVSATRRRPCSLGATPSSAVVGWMHLRPSGTFGDARQISDERDSQLLCVCGKRCTSVTRLTQHQTSCEQFKVTSEQAPRWSASCHHCPWEDEGRASGSQPAAPESLGDSILKLARYRTVNGMSREAVEGVKATVKATMQRAHAQLKEKLASRLGHEAAGLEELVRGVFEAAGDLGSRDSELDALRSSDAYVKPVRRYLGSCPDSKEDFYAYDAPLDRNLETILPHVWEEIKSSATKMQHTVPRTTTEHSDELLIEDVWDGVEFQKFMIKVAIQPGQMPLVFMFYYDGLEVVNGLGQARSTHELGCFYGALLNLSSDKRMHRDYIRLATVCNERAISVCGMESVVAGPPTGPQSTPASWVEWMKRLDRGLTLQTPEGPRIFRGGTAIVAADTPAAAKLMGTKIAVGPSTKSICRNCHCIQTGGGHRQPNSFLASCQGWKRYCAGRSTSFRLRSTDDLRAYAKILQEVTVGKTTNAQLESWMQGQGVNTFHSALWKLPHFSSLTGCPIDLMHIWLEGVGRQNLGAISYWLKKECKASLYKLPDILKEVATSVGIPRSDFPYLTSSRIGHLYEGAKGGVPSTDCSFPGTAGQIAHVLLHIPAIFSSMVPSDKKKDAVWQMALLTCKDLPNSVAAFLFQIRPAGAGQKHLAS